MGCVQAYFRKAHSANMSPSSTQDSERLAPDDSPLDLKERLVTEEPNHVTKQDVVVEAPGGGANGSAKTGNGVGIAAAGTAVLVGAAAATEEVIAHAQQTREDVKKDAEEFVEEVVVEAEKEVEKITSPTPMMATPDEIIITSPSPASSPVEEEGGEVEGEVEDGATPGMEDVEAQSRGKRSVGADEDGAASVSESVADAEATSDSRPQSGTESRPASEAQSASGSRPVSGVKAENESRPVSEIRVESESRPASEVKVDTGSRPASEVKVDTESRPASEVKVDTESRPASEVKVDTESRPASEAKATTESRPASEVKVDTESRPASEVKSETESRPASEVKVDAESRPASEVKVDTESRPASEVKADTESRPASGIQSDSKSRPQSVAEPENESRPASVVKSESGSRPSSEIKVESESAPANESRPASEIKSEQESAPQNESRPVSEMKAESESAPTNESRPVSAEKSESGSRPVSQVKSESGSRPVSQAKSESGSRPVSQVKSESGSRPQSVVDLPEPIEEVAAVVDSAPPPAGTEPPVLVDKEVIEAETGAKPTPQAGVEPETPVPEEVAVSAATTIQATFRGHQARLNLKKVAGDDKEGDAEEEVPVPAVEVAEEDFPPPMEEEVESDLTTTNEDSEVADLPGVVDDLEEANEIPPEPEAETEGDERSTTRAESEAESLGIVCDTPKSSLLEVDDVSRTASNVSESTEDSVTALKGSETESLDAQSRLSTADNDEQDVKSVASSHTGIDGELDKLETAATTIQATFRGFQTRKDLHKGTDDSMLPPPEPNTDFLFGEAVDDDLPPPPDECDLEPPPPEEGTVDATPDPEPVTPRSPETGEKVSRSVDLSQDDSLPGPPNDLNDTTEDIPPPPEEYTITPEELALLQRPTECDELPEHRGGLVNGFEHEPPAEEGESGLTDAELAELQKPTECDELPEHRGGLVNGDVVEVPHECEEGLGDAGETPKDASSAEIDDSSLSSAATKIQAGTRGYLTRKHMKSTFSTTAPSTADSQQSVGNIPSSQDDDGCVQTEGSVETEVQRHSLEDVENGVISVVISASRDRLAENGVDIEENTETTVASKGMSLDSQLTKIDKARVSTTQSEQNNGVEFEDEVVWKTLHNEMEEAATKIQSNFRGFTVRQKLQREDAVQMGTTSSGTPASATSEESELLPPPPPALQSSGEFHDMIVLPDVAQQDATSS